MPVDQKRPYYVPKPKSKPVLKQVQVPSLIIALGDALGAWGKKNRKK